MVGEVVWMISRLPHCLFLMSCLSLPASAQYFNDYDSPPHHYYSAKLDDPMTRLLAEVEAGTKTLPKENGKVLVEYLLKELDMDPESQVVVFSKTSLQKREISPKNPRAIYFNEEIYLGWMPGGRVEISSVDPVVGPVFYFQRPLDEQNGKPFVRTHSCLGCHAGNATNFIPGSLSRSVYPDVTGRNLGSVMNKRLTGHAVPFAERWGGWYVTGKSAGMGHVGNRIAERGPQGARFKPAKNPEPETLGAYFPVEQFPAADSDVAALLVFDHQITMHQRLVEAAYRARQSLHDNGLGADELDPEKLTAKLSRKEFEEGVEMVVEYLLFRDEVPVAKGVRGSGIFGKEFLRDAKRSKDGHSLRDLRLDGRMFERRCSYMIYSRSFEALPPILKQAVYRRLLHILTAEEAPEGFEYLEAAEKKEILHILRETKTDLPGTWREEG